MSCGAPAAIDLAAFIGFDRVDLAEPVFVQKNALRCAGFCCRRNYKNSIFDTFLAVSRYKVCSYICRKKWARLITRFLGMRNVPFSLVKAGCDIHFIGQEPPWLAPAALLAFGARATRFLRGRLHKLRSQRPGARRQI